MWLKKVMRQNVSTHLWHLWTMSFEERKHCISIFTQKCCGRHSRAPILCSFIEYKCCACVNMWPRQKEVSSKQPSKTGSIALTSNHQKYHPKTLMCYICKLEYILALMSFLFSAWFSSSVDCTHAVSTCLARPVLLPPSCRLLRVSWAPSLWVMHPPDLNLYAITGQLRLVIWASACAQVTASAGGGLTGYKAHRCPLHTHIHKSIRLC